MAEDRLTIDPASIFDNVDQHRVEFAATIDGARHAFAAQYDLLRALSGEDPNDRAVAAFHAQEDRIATLGTRAFARDQDQVMVVISENDLD
ncbi:hypothetical protein Q5H91_08050 [Sphingomonas sp. KR1UV-12]|uniref:DUF1488 family protein n=1 Tax=Sphingomonas aurea TaxID=3063994 RepID=A0ABT9EJL6_9SPHN|nr:hypothetical protein [Sphingomonas sp. KR1UV-12]MDP1027160.1 hypothetical protein [Sphingomonas sp. KR1UV-12]